MLNIKSQIIFHGAKLQSDGSYIDTDRGWRWWFNDVGQVHREDGPAAILPDGRKLWYITGHSCPFDEWLIKTNISDETKMLLRLQYV